MFDRMILCGRDGLAAVKEGLRPWVGSVECCDD
jgi:hypothetical protein